MILDFILYYLSGMNPVVIGFYTQMMNLVMMLASVLNVWDVCVLLILVWRVFQYEICYICHWTSWGGNGILDLSDIRSQY